jgi:hypothetical protein
LLLLLADADRKTSARSKSGRRLAKARHRP